MKVAKNYFRIKLLALARETENSPIIFTGKYKHREDPNWVTFTTIRRYVPKEKTKTVCDHINIERDSVARYLTLTEDKHNRKCYICGLVSTYEYHGDVRGCLVLAETGSYSPIWMAASQNDNRSMVQQVLHAAQQFAASDANKRRR